MEVHEALAVLGGLATRAQLVALTSRGDMEGALAEGSLERVARGRYAARGVDGARQEAHRRSGTVCLLSAALLHGWQVKLPPDLPQVAVPRNRRLLDAHRAGVEIRRLDLGPDDARDGVTTMDRTLVDCGRLLPRDAALAVFDSALRAGLTPGRIRRVALQTRGAGAARVRWLAGHASDLAANPFESVLRDLALGVPGLHVRPQVPLWGTEFLGRADLVDTDLRIVLEADSFEWHGGRSALTRDARRYNRMVVGGWLVLRFSWEDVMFDQSYVRQILLAAVAGRTEVSRSCSCGA